MTSLLKYVLVLKRLRLVLTGIEVPDHSDIEKTHTTRPEYTSANRRAYGVVKVEFSILPVPFWGKSTIINISGFQTRLNPFHANYNLSSFN